LTIVLDFGTWWVESFTITHTDLADGASATVTETLVRPGTLLCAGDTVNAPGNVPSSTGGYAGRVRDQGGGNIPPGTDVTGIRSVFRNETGSTVTFTHQIFVLLRKTT